MPKDRDEYDDYEEEDEEETSDTEEPTFRLPKTVKQTASSKTAASTIDAAASDDDDDEDDDEADADDDALDPAGSDADSEANPEDDDENEVLASSRETGPARELASRYMDEDDDEEEDDDEDEHYLQKFDEQVKTNIISDFHPELKSHNYDEVDILSRVIRNEAGAIVDPLHKTLPFLTKYERARILGERAKQLNAGAKPFVEVDPSIIDGYLIALVEFEQKKIPFIIKRPLPNGGCEYWKFQDLEIIDR